MPNDFFRFKKFIIYQNKSAMKVCTDACLFGAYVAGLIQKSKINIQNTGKPARLLDIGTGTGLLSLMLAQKINAIIDAIEMDGDAAQQARENIAASPWHDRIHVHHTTIQAFTKQPINLSTNQPINQPTHQPTYDLIISNPPFFTNALKSNNEQKNAAKHTTTLPLHVLASSINKLLNKHGYACIMLPPAEMKQLEQEMFSNDLYPQHSLYVKQTPAHDPFRVITLFTTQAQPAPTEELIVIRETGQQYTEAFIALLKDYYLYL